MFQLLSKANSFRRQILTFYEVFPIKIAGSGIGYRVELGGFRGGGERED
jgi:hypothetical protein